MIRRKRLDDDSVRQAGRALARRLRDFAPDTVVYIARGGKLLGEVISHELSVPICELDLSYPASRLAPWVPRLLRTLAAPAKEIAYRLTSPRANKPLGLPSPQGRVVLVDDTASTGRTIEVAIDTLIKGGVDASRIRVAVIRCGPRVRSMVDYYETETPVLFLGR